MQRSSIKRKYTLDDYLKDKVAVSGVSSAGTATTGLGFRTPAPAGSLQQANALLEANKNPAIKTFRQPTPSGMLQAEIARNPNAGMPTVQPLQGPLGVNTQTGGSTGTDTTQPEAPSQQPEAPSQQPVTQAQLTTVYTSQMMNQALQSLVDFNNRKFKYNAKESPLYTILQRQAEAEAQKASGRAYAASVANTGGYGSSYATLAAEEASRQVMEDMDDQQYALYQAARDEFEAERQSRLDWYSQARQSYSDAMAMEEYEKLKAEEEALAESGLDENTLAATEYLRSTYGTSYSENAMKNDLLSKGYSEAEANAALEAQKKVAGAVVTDYKASSVSDAITNANTLKQAYDNKYITTEEYDAALKENATVIMDNANAAMKDIDDADYAALGITEEEWSGMDDGDKKLEIIDRVGQLVKEGVVPHSDYYKLLYNDLKGEFSSQEYNDSKEPLREAADMAIVIKDAYNNGYLLKDDYMSLVYQTIAPHIENNALFKGIVNAFEKYGEEDSRFDEGIYYAMIAEDSKTTPKDASEWYNRMSEEQKEMILEMVKTLAQKTGPIISKPKKKGTT